MVERKYNFTQLAKLWEGDSKVWEASLKGDFYLVESSVDHILLAIGVGTCHTEKIRAIVERV